MPGHDIIVIGASAGGVEALARLVSDLPAEFPAAIFICLHISPHGSSMLPQILSRKGALPALHPVDGQSIEPGHIYIAPPDVHMLVRRGRILLSHGPRENSHRPSIDPLFRSAARAYGRRVVGVVMTGALDDGTAGLVYIKALGGTAVVQDPEEALFPGMPRNAVDNVKVDWVLPLSEIVPRLVQMAQEPVVEEADRLPQEMEQEMEVTEHDIARLGGNDRPGTPSGYTCPECHGALWEMREGEIYHYRCRTGHAFSPDTLMAEQTESLEAALWMALRALEEKESIAQRLADRARERGHRLAAEQFGEQVQATKEHAKTIRDVIMHGRTTWDSAPPITPKKQLVKTHER